MHRDTNMRLLVEVGSGSAKLMDEQMRHLPCRRTQVDEIWAYAGKKQVHQQPGETWRHVDVRRVRSRNEADSYLPRRKAYRTNAVAFIGDLADFRRMRSARMSMLSSARSAPMSIMGKRLNLTKPNQSGRANARRRGLTHPGQEPRAVNRPRCGNVADRLIPEQ